MALHLVPSPSPAPALPPRVGGQSHARELEPAATRRGSRESSAKGGATGLLKTSRVSQSENILRVTTIVSASRRTRRTRRKKIFVLRICTTRKKRQSKRAVTHMQMQSNHAAPFTLSAPQARRKDGGP